MLALCGEGMLCVMYSFVHSGSGVEFAVEFVLKGFDLAVGFRVVFVLNGFDLASRIKSRHPPTRKVRGL